MDESATSPPDDPIGHWQYLTLVPVGVCFGAALMDVSRSNIATAMVISSVGVLAVLWRKLGQPRR